MKLALTVLLVVSVSLFSGCTKKEKLLNKIDILKMVWKVDKTARLIKPKEMTGGIKCSNYGDGCLAGHTGRIIGLEMIFLEFNSQKNAKIQALKIDGYYYKNWVFDDVSGEPDLEKFVENHLHGIRARKEAGLELKK